MTDLWGFLLQTLTASGTAVLLLAVKAFFRDKLPPRWQFGIWGILGIVLIIPAGLNGKYVLLNWRFLIEILKARLGDFSFPRVLFPFPIIASVPHTLFDWIFVAYTAGVVFFLLYYPVSYIRLRLLLRSGNEASPEQIALVRSLEKAEKVKPCRVTAVPGLPAPFVCGIFRPVMVLPEDVLPESTVILHELIHLKHGDCLWSIVICFLRCLHWCNPLLVFCSKKALNDMESRCDQIVLERLKGEERRDYGRLLLSMANERFAKTPGSTCINNGGKNIRTRIENIARFRTYPKGMGLVSVCILILLVLPLSVGARTPVIRTNDNNISLSLAWVRSIPCTTAAGAFDTYIKAVIDGNGYFRAVCAPEEEQEAILKEMQEKSFGIYPLWDSGRKRLGGGDYCLIYNLKKISDTRYEGLMVIGRKLEDDFYSLTCRNLRAENQGGRWVIIPLDEFRYVDTDTILSHYCPELPGIPADGNGRVYQTVQTVGTALPSPDQQVFDYDRNLKPNANFSPAAIYWSEPESEDYNDAL
ncbi:MAG: M56 family metallopeptidase [Lachnospiraceae bacterium]|nr:M56 family metallopeptidase [Lachnospiraceae bacterium]